MSPEDLACFPSGGKTSLPQEEAVSRAMGRKQGCLPLVMFTICTEVTFENEAERRLDDQAPQQIPCW